GSEVVSRNDLVGLLDRLPSDVRSRVDGGELAYAWSTVGDTDVLVVGGRPADGGPAVYFVHDVSAIRAAIDQLRVALAIGAIALVVVGLLTSRRIARGILAPVEDAAAAAKRIEAGDLAARVPVTSDDEFGAWAEAFNAMAATLEATIGRLEATQDQQRRFVADVAHELRTPVTALVAEASIVEANLATMPEASRRTAELLVADIRRLRDLVEELMELSRFDAGAEQLVRQPVDLVVAIRAVIAARLPTAAFDAPIPAPVIDTDPRRLERILANLLDNAREHAAGAGVEVELTSAGTGVVIAVADRGPGVPPDRLDRIFERFAKLDPSRRSGGSGLGLAIAAEHAAVMGGSLRAMARPGGGLRLELGLPTHDADVTASLRDGDGTVNGGAEAMGIDPPHLELGP
ncbi:MAG TPA: ATP-binding protein, partial [Candidatus Limnocylindrales bacterium]